MFLSGVFGFLAGIVGGMGMGGGTVLVPLLGFLDIPQRQMQAINLISFLPMSIVALGFHFKNKLVKTKNILYTIIPACVTSVGGAILAQHLDNKILKILFALFILFVGVRMLFGGKKPKKKLTARYNPLLHSHQFSRSFILSRILERDRVSMREM